MSPEPSRRAALLGLLGGALLLGACGFAPAYAPGETGAALRGRVAVEAPDTPDGYLLRAALEERLGPPGDGALTLTAGLSIETVAAAIRPDGAITRYDLSGRAPWVLGGRAGPVAQGEATAFAGYSTTGTTVATRAAEADARDRVAALLADAIVARLLLVPPGTLP